MFTAALFTIAKKQPICPSTDDKDVACVYSAIKENEIMLFSLTWMDLEMITLSQKEKDKYRMLSFICPI